MKDIIITELTQAVQDLARGFAHYLPPLDCHADRCPCWMDDRIPVEGAGAQRFAPDQVFQAFGECGVTQFLNQAALPTSTELLSRFVFWVAWVRFYSPGRQRTRDRRS